MHEPIQQNVSTGDKVKAAKLAAILLKHPEAQVLMQLDYGDSTHSVPLNGIHLEGDTIVLKEKPRG